MGIIRAICDWVWGAETWFELAANVVAVALFVGGILTGIGLGIKRLWMWGVRRRKPCATPPEPLPPYFKSGFALEEHFTGRVPEREALTQWFTSSDRPVFCLSNIGGIGKSSVAWVWAHRDVAEVEVVGLPGDTRDVEERVRVPEDQKPAGLLFWGFYEGGGTFEGFLGAAAEYLSEGQRTAQDYVTLDQAGGNRLDYGRMQQDVIQTLGKRRFLVIWDGAERLLREYGGTGAELKEERDPKELDPDARDCVDNRVGTFLAAMCQQSASRLLLCSRLYPRVLERLPGAEERKLVGLAEDNAVEYLRRLGVKGHRAELSEAAAQYEFHPQSLTNLVAALRDHTDDEADIADAPQYDQTEEAAPRRHHILAKAYDRRTTEQRELLSRLAAMRGTIPREVVSLLAEDVSGLDEATLWPTVVELQKHGLLRRLKDRTYSFHPVIRRYCYRRLKYKEGVHSQLRDYFDAVPEPEEIEGIEDLAPVIELYHHTVHAGRYDEAWRLYGDRLWRPIYYQFGAYQMEIELLRPLFPSGEDKPPKLEDEEAQAWTLNELANSYSRTGQSRRAVPLMEAANAVDEERSETQGVAIGLGNLAQNQMPLGELEAAETSLRRSIELCREIEDEFWEAVGYQDLGRLVAYEAKSDEAEEELGKAFEGFGEQGATQSQCVVASYRALRALLMGEPAAALKAAREAFAFWRKDAAEVSPVERDRMRVEWLLGWAHVALAEEQEGEERDKGLAEAEDHLTEALTRCRRVNMVDHEPDIVLAWARWHRLKGSPEEAREYAEEALAIADRCEYRLKQADAHNLLARLDLEAGKLDAAREHAEIARERAECDGDPHWYKPAIDEAERLAGEIGRA